MYKFPALPISSTASHADDSERFSYRTRAFSTYKKRVTSCNQLEKVKRKGSELSNAEMILNSCNSNPKIWVYTFGQLLLPILISSSKYDVPKKWRSLIRQSSVGSGYHPGDGNRMNARHLAVGRHLLLWKQEQWTPGHPAIKWNSVSHCKLITRSEGYMGNDFCSSPFYNCTPKFVF